jgi:hypothetical protein
VSERVHGRYGGKGSPDAILTASPELAAVTASVRAFAAIMNERRGRKRLEPWMTAAEAAGEPALRSFVTGLRADQDGRAKPDPRLKRHRCLRSSDDVRGCWSIHL